MSGIRKNDTGPMLLYRHSGLRNCDSGRRETGIACRCSSYAENCSMPLLTVCYKDKVNIFHKFNFIKSSIIQLNEDFIKDNLKDLVRDSVEETLNALLNHEADEFVCAGKYERTGDRKGYRFGHCERNFGTTSGEVRLRVSKLKGSQFEMAIIYHRALQMP